MLINEDQFYLSWEEFLENIRQLLKRQIVSKHDPRYQSLNSLVDDVINELKTSEPFIRHAINQTDPTILDYAGRELKFFNALADQSQPSSNESDEDLADKAETIKTSVEKIFHIHIPEKVKHVLDILNELLKLLT